MKYPSHPIGRSSTKTPRNFVDIEVSANGTIRGRSYQSIEVYDFTVHHPAISLVDAKAIHDFWFDNRASVITLDWPEDASQYTNVVFKGPPHIETLGGSLANVTVQMVGSK